MKNALTLVNNGTVEQNGVTYRWEHCRSDISQQDCLSVFHPCGELMTGDYLNDEDSYWDWTDFDRDAPMTDIVHELIRIDTL